MCLEGSQRSCSPPHFWLRYLAPKSFSRGNPGICSGLRRLPATLWAVLSWRARAARVARAACSSLGWKYRASACLGLEVSSAFLRTNSPVWGFCVLAGICPATTHQPKLEQVCVLGEKRGRCSEQMERLEAIPPADKSPRHWSHQVGLPPALQILKAISSKPRVSSLCFQRNILVFSTDPWELTDQAFFQACQLPAVPASCPVPWQDGRSRSPPSPPHHH